jgi:hypothetical protein
MRWQNALHHIGRIVDRFIPAILSYTLTTFLALLYVRAIFLFSEDGVSSVYKILSIFTAVLCGILYLIPLLLASITRLIQPNTPFILTWINPIDVLVSVCQILLPLITIPLEFVSLHTRW